MIKERHQKTADLQDHFDIRDEDLEETLDKFIEEDEIPKKKKRKINIPVVVGAAFVGIAIFAGIQELTGGTGIYNQDFLGMLMVLGGVMILLLGMGVAGVKRRNKRKSRNKKQKKQQKQRFETDADLDDFGLKKKKKLFRSSRDSMLFGVCGGIAEYYDIDPTIVRIAFAIATLYYGSSILLYLVLAIFIPKREEEA